MASKISGYESPLMLRPRHLVPISTIEIAMPIRVDIDGVRDPVSQIITESMEHLSDGAVP